MVKEHALNIGIIIKLLFISPLMDSCNNFQKPIFYIRIMSLVCFLLGSK
jgi:hypothetical protein